MDEVESLPEPSEAAREKPAKRPGAGRRWRIPTVALGLALALKLAAGFFPGAVESVYSRGLFPYVAKAQSLVNRWFGFSLAEFLIIGLIALALIYLARSSWLAVRGRRPWKRLLSVTGFRAYCVIAYGLLLFLVVWGLNYDRRPVAVNFDLPNRAPSNEELLGMCRRIVTGINENYVAAAAPVGPDGGTMLPLDRAELVRALNDSYHRQAGDLLLRDFTLGPPKPVFFSRVMTRMGITGVYNPFTGEPNYDREVPAVEQPFVMAHEMAHQRGFAREDEANFVAFIICVNSDNAYVRYSGYFDARTVVRRLAAESPDQYRALSATLGPGPRADLLAVRRFWQRFQGQTTVATNYVNDKYLKANRVANGTENYLDSDGLIIAYYLKMGW